MAEAVIAARQVDLHAIPVGAEFLGQDLGEAVMSALPHLRLRTGHMDRAIGGDREEHTEPSVVRRP
jgi:hypothetical protein